MPQTRRRLMKRRWVAKRERQRVLSLAPVVEPEVPLLSEINWERLEAYGIQRQPRRQR